MTRVDFYFIGLVFSHWKGRKKETERNSSAKNGRGSRYKTSKQLHYCGIWMYTKGGISIQIAMSHKILRGSQEEACRLAWVESRLLSSQQRLTPGWQGLCTFPGETGSPWRLGGGLTPICSILSEYTVTAGGQLEFCGSRESGSCQEKSAGGRQGVLENAHDRINRFHCGYEEKWRTDRMTLRTSVWRSCKGCPGIMSRESDDAPGKTDGTQWSQASRVWALPEWHRKHSGF